MMMGVLGTGERGDGVRAPRHRPAVYGGDAHRAGHREWGRAVAWS